MLNGLLISLKMWHEEDTPVAAAASSLNNYVHSPPAPSCPAQEVLQWKKLSQVFDSSFLPLECPRLATNLLISNLKKGIPSFALQLFQILRGPGVAKLATYQGSRGPSIIKPRLINHTIYLDRNIRFGK